MQSLKQRFRRGGILKLSSMPSFPLFHKVFYTSSVFSWFSLTEALALFSPFLILISHLFIPLTNLPCAHRLSASDLLHISVLPSPSVLRTLPFISTFLTILTLNVRFPLHSTSYFLCKSHMSHTHTHTLQKYYVVWYVVSQLCKFAVNLPSISVASSSAVYEAGGHDILVQQLCGSCPRMVANSAATLGNMAGQEVIRTSILSHGAIQALVEPLKSTDTQVLVNSTQCLAVLVCDTEARAEVGVCVYLMADQNSDLFSHLRLIRIFWNLETIF